MADRVRLGIKVPQSLKKLIDMYLDSEPTYVNISEFARSAFSEKIKKDTPWLYEEVSRSDKKPTS